MSEAMMKILKESAFVLIFFYSLGYIFLILYYHLYGISISSYLSIMDIIYASLKVIFYFIMAIMQFFPGFFIGELLLRKSNKDDSVSRIGAILFMGMSSFMVVNSVLNLFFPKLQFIVLWTLPLAIMTVVFSTFEKKITNYIKRLLISEERIFFTIIIISIVMAFIIASPAAFVEDENTRHDASFFERKIIEFQEKDCYYSTAISQTSHYDFIGETADYLFLYDALNKQSLIFRKENISDFKVKNVNTFKWFFFKI